MPRVTALTTWQLGRGVYVSELEVADQAVRRPLDPYTRISVDDWHRAVLPPLKAWIKLSERCCCVACPADFIPPEIAEPAFTPAGCSHTSTSTSTPGGRR